MDPQPQKNDPHDSDPHPGTTRTAREDPEITEAGIDLEEEDLPRFTPGPWEVSFSPFGYSKPPDEVIIHAPEIRYAILELDHRFIDWEENAFLIATAPDLVVVALEALKAQPCQIDASHKTEPWEAMAWAAFRKARLPGMERPGGCYHCLAEDILELLA